MCFYHYEHTYYVKKIFNETKELRSYTLSCVKIWGYLLNIIKPLTLGQIKLCMDSLYKNPKKKFKLLIFQYAKSYFCKKNY